MAVALYGFYMALASMNTTPTDHTEAKSILVHHAYLTSNSRAAEPSIKKGAKRKL